MTAFDMEQSAPSFFAPSSRPAAQSSPAKGQGSSRPRGRRRGRLRRPSIHRVDWPLRRDTLADRAYCAPDDPDTARLLDLWDSGAEDSRRLAAKLRALAPWGDRDATTDEGLAALDLAADQVAQALRTTTNVASRLIEEAHRAVTRLPRLMDLLEEGSLPVRWFQATLRSSASLPDEVLEEFDAEIASWELSVAEDRYCRNMRALVRWFKDREAIEDRTPAERSVNLYPPDEDGYSCLEVRGPSAEILAMGQRLDAAARAVQREQRHRLAELRDEAQRLAQRGDGEDRGAILAELITQADLPFDDGSIAATGRAMSRAALRYALLTRSVIDTGGIAVPSHRFRISVTVPALTLLGAVDAPGLLDGIHPIPADMARELAAGEKVWHRILTDPTTGAFLPLPATRYTATPDMLEHLRLRNPVCAVPGCSRPVGGTGHGAEMDHIIEFDHRDPERGGSTEIDNTHLLCWQHHRHKTSGHLTPERTNPCEPEIPDPLAGFDPMDPSTYPVGPIFQPGQTVWRLTRTLGATAPDESDLITPLVVREFLENRAAIAERRAALCRPPDSGGADGPPPGTASFPAEPPF